ncbi:MAG: hypothetical protein Q4G44_04780 [Alcaligenaceae bacterium]|nr:hypothetical protein [Alcaligenaceae bacterium]
MSDNSFFTKPQRDHKKSPTPHEAERFREQLGDFFRFIVKPDFRRGHGRGTGDGWFKDWQLNLPWKRLFQWAAFMWAINILVLAPIALVAAGGVNATHRLQFSYMLLPLAVLWAPIVEEILFRFNIRRPLLALWMVPVMIFVLLMQGTVIGTLCLIAVVAIVMILYPKLGLDNYRGRWRLRFKYLKLYRKYFVVIMHLLVFGFAYIHIFNYEFDAINVMTTLVMVMPQWFSGLALMWMRVRYGIGNAIYLHAIFNGGPVFLIMTLKLLGVPLT